MHRIEKGVDYKFRYPWDLLYTCDAEENCSILVDGRQFQSLESIEREIVKEGTDWIKLCGIKAQIITQIDVTAKSMQGTVRAWVLYDDAKRRPMDFSGYDPVLGTTGQGS